MLGSAYLPNLVTQSTSTQLTFFEPFVSTFDLPVFLALTTRIPWLLPVFRKSGSSLVSQFLRSSRANQINQSNKFLLVNWLIIMTNYQSRWRNPRSTSCSTGISRTFFLQPLRTNISSMWMGSVWSNHRIICSSGGRSGATSLQYNNWPMTSSPYQW